MEDQKNSEPKQRMSVVRMENSAFAFFVSFSQFRSQTGITLDDLEMEILKSKKKIKFVNLPIFWSECPEILLSERPPPASPGEAIKPREKHF